MLIIFIKRIREIEQGVSANSGFSQSSQLADEHFEKANQLYKQGRILAACGMFEKSVEAEKEQPKSKAFISER